MATKRQIAANRANAEKSSGPRSADGKALSRRNALRHGLSIPSRAISAYQQDVILLARALSPAGEEIGGAALDAADAEIDILRVRTHRVALIDKLDALERYERRAISRRNKALRNISGGR